MKPKNWIKGRHFYYTHMAQTEGVVEAVVQSLKVANGATISFVANLIERLIDGKQLEERFSKARLLFTDASIDLVIATSGIGGKAI
jgi:hypothetical protein